MSRRRRCSRPLEFEDGYEVAVKELVDAGLLKGVPRDPAGYPYELGEGGKAEVNLQSPLVEEILLDRPMLVPAVK